MIQRVVLLCLPSNGPALMLSNSFPGSALRLQALDGFRGVAVLLVIVSHFPYAANFRGDGGYLVGLGDIGVRAFFVLSGFLISSSLLRESELTGRVSVRNFFVRRIFRLAPTHYTYLLVLLVLALFGIYSDDLSSWLGSFGYVRNILGNGRSATVHFWSLAIEAQFYIIWPFLYIAFCLQKTGRGVLVASVFIVGAVLIRFLHPEFVLGGNIFQRAFGSRSLLRYADSIAFGILGSYVFAWMRTRRNLSHEGEGVRLDLALSQISLLYLPALILLPNLHVVPIALLPTLQALISTLLIADLVLGESLLSNILRWMPMVFIGKISYSLYVWHFLFLSHFVLKLNVVGEEHPDWVFFIYDVNTWIIPSFLAAILSYYFLEKPFFRLRGRLRNSWDSSCASERGALLLLGLFMNV